jgi:hypothetical protein
MARTKLAETLWLILAFVVLTGVTTAILLIVFR